MIHHHIDKEVLEMTIWSLSRTLNENEIGIRYFPTRHCGTRIINTYINHRLLVIEAMQEGTEAW
jgi:hypothetical protein